MTILSLGVRINCGHSFNALLVTVERLNICFNRSLDNDMFSHTDHMFCAHVLILTNDTKARSTVAYSNWARSNHNNTSERAICLRQTFANMNRIKRLTRAFCNLNLFRSNLRDDLPPSIAIHNLCRQRTSEAFIPKTAHHINDMFSFGGWVKSSMNLGSFE